MKQPGNLKQLLVLLSLVLTINCFSTPKDIQSRNSFIAELCINQNLDLYSILYDRLLKSTGTVNFGLQTGLTFSTAVSGDRGYSKFYPIKGYFLVGRSNHKFEAGFGVRIHSYDHAFSLNMELGWVFPDVNVGYRYKPVDNGLCFRAGYNGFVLPGGINHLASLSIGYTF